MKKILFMHGGSRNHGCEAIVRTTSQLLGGPKDVVLSSMAKHQDLEYGVDKTVEQIVSADEFARFSLPYFEAQFKYRVLNNKKAFQEVFARYMFKGNMAISVGGDNYCYPECADECVQTNKNIRRYCKYTVLWGCSVDKADMTPAVIEDLANYDLITARESISYELLKQINPNTIQVADSAFLLETTCLPLPDGFLEGNTVGINASPLILNYRKDDNMILKNYEMLLKYILNNTDMSICLIPHVVEEGGDDRKVLQELYDRIQDHSRICIAPDGNCCELKGYISRCRFFIGARTHATVAAYSSCVPTLVTGYSVKAKGIAQDLFGTHEKYVLPVQDLKSEQDLVKQFMWLQEHESEIRSRLEEFIPEYKERAEYGKLRLEQLING